MTETHLEMIENRAERENDALALELCREIRALHRRIHDQKPRPQQFGAVEVVKQVGADLDRI